MDSSNELQQLTARVVSAYVTLARLPPEALSEIIRSVHATFAGLGVAPAIEELRPAVPIKKSVFPDYLVCLEDGKKLKTLKRHLKTSYGMTPAMYRARWKLPEDYPMVAPTYSAHRSVLAKEAGLGRLPMAEPLVQRVAEGVTGKRAGRQKAA